MVTESEFKKKSNRNTVKQTVQNGAKILDDEDGVAGITITSLGPGVKNLRLRHGLEFDGT